MLRELTAYLTGPENFTAVIVDLADPQWVHGVEPAIPAAMGWYYISTNTPVTTIQLQELPARFYTNPQGREIRVGNYDLRERSIRFNDGPQGLWSDCAIYSGYAGRTLLDQRAVQHTYPHLGTGGLALGRYPDLHQYQWSFHYATLAGFLPNCANPIVVLRLGEQIWRSHYGWPILCDK